MLPEYARGDGDAFGAIDVRGLSRTFGSHRALCGIDLHAPRGQILGLLGPNGAGKTTTVRVLTTLLRPDSGQIRVAGYDPVTEPRQVRRRIGLSGQYSAVDEKLTGDENLRMVGRLYGMSRRNAAARSRELLERFRLTEVARRRSGTYSGGMRRRLDLAGALVAAPEVVVLDEPTTGLDPRGRLDTWEVVAGLADAGTTVLLTTQYMEEADQLADAITVIDHGTVIAHGTAEELKAAAGGERIDLVVEHALDLTTAVEIVTRYGQGKPVVDTDAGRVSVAAASRHKALAAVLNDLEEAGVPVRDASLRRPSLDDAFLVLTGNQSEPAGETSTDAAEPAVSATTERRAVR